MALYREGKAAMAADGTVTGTGTKWQSSLSLIRPGATIMFLSSPIQMAVVNKVVSDTEIKAITTNGAVVASTDYAILLSDSLTVDGLAQDVAETLRYYQSQEAVIAEAVEFFKDFNFEELQNLANQIKVDSESAGASATAAAESESKAKTSETNAKASEVAAETARDQVQQIIDDAGEQSTLVVLAHPTGGTKVGAETKRPPAIITRTVGDLLLDGVAGLRKNFGAKGDGVTDDTQAFRDWWACLMDVSYKRNGAKSNEPSFMLQKGPRLNIENGQFVVQDLSLSIGSTDSFVFNVVGESSLSTKIINLSDTYLFDLENNPVQSYFGNLTVYGGLGALRYKSTASNPTGIHLLEHLRLSRYKECGISNNSIDFPYIRLDDIMFYGDTSYDTIGACISGLSAGGYVANCVFSDNKYGLKLSTAQRNTTINGPATPFNIEKNDFYRTGLRAEKESHDVWIVPGQSTNNAGRGIVFNRNKFGSENLAEDDTHILIASQETVAEAQDAGRTGMNGDRQHSDDVSTGYVSGLSFEKNNVNSVHGANQIPFVLCNTPNFGNNEFRDLYDNGMPEFIIKFHSSITQSEVTNLTRSNVFHAPQCMALQEGVLPQSLSNLNDVFKLVDPLNYYTGHPQSGYYPVGTQKIDFVSLFSGPTGNMTILDATRTLLNNSYGGINEANEVTMTASTGRLYALISGGVAGRKTWLDLELKAGSSNPVSAVKVEIRDSAGTVIWLRRFIRMDTINKNWQKVLLPFSPSVSGSFFVIVRAEESYIESTANQFIVGNVNVYMNDCPISTGHNSGLSMSFNRQHTVNGNYHEWYDASGNKRAKKGAPTSDTDGVIISANPVP